MAIDARSCFASAGAESRAIALNERTRLRARTDELAALMTSEGGKPVIENADEVDWCAAAFDYYAEIGRDSAGRVIPPIEPSQLALVVKDALGVVGCIVLENVEIIVPRFFFENHRDVLQQRRELRRQCL